jgi:hypothetical protein
MRNAKKASKIKEAEVTRTYLWTVLMPPLRHIRGCITSLSLSRAQKKLIESDIDLFENQFEPLVNEAFALETFDEMLPVIRRYLIWL